MSLFIQNLRNILKNSFALLLFICAIINLCKAQDYQLEENWWKTNGTVYSIERQGDTVYVGGSFDYVGPDEPHLAVLSSSTGLPNLTFLNPNGPVNSVVPDGAGGWYIGGNFTQVGGQNRNSIAQINSLGQLTSFCNSSGFDGTITSLLLDGTLLYAAGDFKAFGNIYHGNGVALNNADGMSDLNYLAPNGEVRVVIPDGSGGWYIGGSFTMVGNQMRNRLARLNPDGTLHSWNPNADNTVSSILISGSNVYVGGSFTSIGGQTRNRLAAIDAMTGLATSWNPDANGTVSSISISGSNVYVGGSFTSIGGQTRNRLAAIDAMTGLATSWNPAANNIVNSIAISGSIVYAGGSFTSIGGQARSRLAAIDATTGLATSWNPDSNGTVNSIAISGSNIYVGGLFTSIGGQMRSRLAAIDATTGLATSWNPYSNNTVNSIAISGSNVYVGGLFNLIGGEARIGLVSIDVNNSIATSWNPNSNGTVNSIAISGSNIYVGGSFTSIGGQARIGLAAIDATTGLATAWNPNSNSVVNSIAISGSIVYAGGSFTSIGGQARNRLAAIDATSGLATLWNPNADNTINSIAISGSNVYVGGGFTNIGGQTRNRLAVISATTGLVAAWNPNADNTIFSIAISGSNVYVGGDFTIIGGQIRNKLAAINATTGLATSWIANADNTINSISISGSNVYVGGSFKSIGGQTRNRLVAIDATTGVATSWNPNASSTVASISISGSNVYVGGSFTSVGGQLRNSLAAIDVTTGLATSWNPNSNGTVNSIAISGSNIYVGGSFTSIGGQARIRLAAIDATTGLATSWNPDANGTVSSISISGSNVYVGGSFTSIGGQTRNRLAAIDAMTGLATSWNPAANNIVNSIAISGSIVYAGGSFTSIGGQARNRLAAIDAITGLATLWNPSASNTINSISISGSNVYVGGSFTSIGGQARNGLAAIDATTGLATLWNPYAGFSVYSIAVSGSIVYVGGSFLRISGKNKENFAVFSLLNITLQPFISSSLCAGSSSNFQYNSANLFNSGNVFTAQISDALGSFTSPTIIGSLNSTSNGNIPITIPVNLPSGTGYRIRVVSSNPVITGSDNGSNITVISPSNWYLDADNDGYGSSSLTTSACIAPAGYVSNSTDCNDASGTIFPGATEICNSVDDDCNGTMDEGVQITFYADSDSDTYGNAGVITSACTLPLGYVSNSTDCNDTLVTIYPGATETCNSADDDCDGTSDEGLQITFYADADSDTFGNSVITTSACTAPTGYVSNSTDCNDALASAHPNAIESCNGVDDDCDGTSDEGVQITFYADADSDTYGSAAVTTSACTAPAGYVSNSADCNDASMTIYSGATETCNSVDDDCDGSTDEGVQTTYYADSDNDTYGNSAVTTAACSAPAGYVSNSTDCNDTLVTIYPGATETCNSADDDCDGAIDNSLNFVNYYADNDGDTYGAGTATNACQSPGATFVTNNADCNDSNNLLHSVTTELCNGLDDDCDGSIDDGVLTTYYLDLDLDNYGDSLQPLLACSLPVGYSIQPTDCADNNSAIFPTAIELCSNYFDDNCSGQINEGCGNLIPGDDIYANVPVVVAGQFGTGIQPSSLVSLTLASDSPQNAGSGNDMWFTFTPQSNSIRIALSGSSTVADDNEVLLYNYTNANVNTIVPIVFENDVHPGSSGISLDGGDEIMLTDQLIPGNIYWICVRNVNGNPGLCKIQVANLMASQADIGAYTNYTNTYASTCQNFKAAFRSGAVNYVVNKWNSNSISGTPVFTYQIPSGTVCQMGRITPANLSGSNQTVYVSVDAVYNLPDAFGNANTLTARGATVATITMNAEAPVVVRSTDTCPVYKTITGSIATNRSVCGTKNYTWEFTLINSLPFNEEGALGASRILSLSQVDGIANGQQYGVRIRSNHFDNVSNSGFSTSACVQTIGFAGMPTVEDGGAIAERSENGVTTSIYPNPNTGQSVNFAVAGMEGDMNVRIVDATGRMVYANRYIVEGSLNTTIDFGQTLAGGVFMVEMIQNGEMKTMRMVVNR